MYYVILVFKRVTYNVSKMQYTQHIKIRILNAHTSFTKGYRFVSLTISLNTSDYDPIKPKQVTQRFLN